MLETLCLCELTETRWSTLRDEGPVPRWSSTQISMLSFPPYNHLHIDCVSDFAECKKLSLSSAAREQTSSSGGAYGFIIMDPLFLQNFLLAVRKFAATLILIHIYGLLLFYGFFPLRAFFGRDKHFSANAVNEIEWQRWIEWTCRMRVGERGGGLERGKVGVGGWSRGISGGGSERGNSIALPGEPWGEPKLSEIITDWS